MDEEHLTWTTEKKTQNAENWPNGPFENGFQEIFLPDQNTGQNKCNHFFKMATDDIIGTLAPKTTPD